VYRTVRGFIENDSLGTTFIHEHLYVVPNDLPKYEDYTLDDIDRSIAEVISFKNAGGNTIVDLTPVNYGRNPLVLKKIAEAADINVMFVTGFHKEEFQPKWMEKLSNEALYDFLLHEITEGVTSAKLLPAAMKIGTSFNHITESEKRVIRIAGKVQHETGIPMITHCDKGTMGLEQLELLKENGADLTHVCLSHVDLTQDINYIEKICQTGASISFDHIGRELETKDSKKISMLKQLVEEGFEDQICLAGDMGRKKYLRAYNGKPGLDYILTEFRERVLEAIPERSYKKMIQDNPRRILSWE